MDTEKEKKVTPTKPKDDLLGIQKLLMKNNLQQLFHSVIAFLKNILSIREGTDIDGTIAGIKKDMVFQGHTVWILIASIFIASIGLNVNSTAVVIGAMLISPLMGPILAIGLSVGTNDWDTLMRSLKNFGIAIVISLITSFIFFLITPLKDASPELLARTKPTFLDVLIAIFGGLAGIVAGSRSEKSNVIPGVAIATALMPPLCTAGYGLATGQLAIFAGAFYLFFLNSVFISLSTFVIVRYLKFPLKNFVDHVKEKKLKRYMTIFVIIIILPSASIFWEVIKESRFQAKASSYINEYAQFEKSEIVNKKITFSDTLSSIELYIIGEEIPEYRIQEMNNHLTKYGLSSQGSFWDRGFKITDKTVLKIHQAKSESDLLKNKINYLSDNLSKEVRVGILEEIYQKNEQLIKNKDEQIRFLENQLINYKKDTMPITNLQKEIKVQYPKIEKFAYAKSIEIHSDSTPYDTIPTFLVKWNGYAWKQQRDDQKMILENWLKVRLNLDTVRVIEYQ